MSTSAEMAPAQEQAILANEHGLRNWFHDHTRTIVRTGAAALAITVGAVGIGDAVVHLDGGSSTPAGAAANPYEQSTGARTASGCESLESDDVQAVPPSIFGQMYSQEGSANQVPFSAVKASDQIMAEACDKQLPLAVSNAIYEIYESQEQSASDMGSTIENFLATVAPGSQAAQTAESNFINLANIMTPTTKEQPFVVDKGTMEIVATPTGFQIKPAQLPSGTADGYRIAVNNQENNPIVQQRFNNLGNIFLFTTRGTVLVNETISPESFSNQANPNESPSSTNPNTSQSTTPNNSSQPQGSGVTTSGKTKENLSGNGVGTSTGPTHEATPGVGPTPSGGASPSGTTPNTAPAAPPNTTSSTSPNTPPTTVITTPTSTVPVSTTTTTSPNKTGVGGCDPNIYAC